MSTLILTLINVIEACGSKNGQSEEMAVKNGWMTDRLILHAQFFMKATHLEQMKDDFVYIKATKHVTEDKVAQHAEVRTSLSDAFIFYYSDAKLYYTVLNHCTVLYCSLVDSHLSQCRTPSTRIA